MSLVLASESPRRAVLLRFLCHGFDIEPAAIAEDTPGPVLADAVRLLAVRKAAVVARRRPDAVVLAADTVVVLDGRVLGKPQSDDEANAMLRALDGRDHEVWTAVAWCRRGASGAAEGRAIMAQATVRLDLGDARHAYVEAGAWQGKAGGYGLQDAAVAQRARLRTGSWSTVVGLPLAETATLLAEAGVAVRAAPDEAALAQHNPFLSDAV